MTMYSDTITLFNFHNDMWFPHVIWGVDAVGISSGAGATALNGTTKTDSGVILIQSSSNKVINADNTLKYYAPPKEYAALENVKNTVTFQPQKDFIILGKYESTEPIADDDYVAGFYDEMNSRYDTVYQIVSAVFYSLIPHFEIGVR